MNLASLIISILGLIISALGFLFTIKQVRDVKKLTKQTQDKVNDEVMKAQSKIRSGLDILEMTKVIKLLDESINYLNENKLDFVDLRMRDIEQTLEEACAYNGNGVNLSGSLLSDYRDTMSSLSKFANEPDKINKEHVSDVLASVRTNLIRVDLNLKNSLYGKG